MANISNNTSIVSDDSLYISPELQSEIRARFATSENKNVEVRFSKKDETYDLYQDDEYVCSFDFFGNEV